MVSRTISLGGVPVAFHARAAETLEPMLRVVAGFPESDARPPHWRVLVLDRSALPFGAAFGQPLEGQLPEGHAIRVAFGPDGRQKLVGGQLGIRISNKRRLVICRAGGEPKLLRTTAGIGLLDAILEQEGQHLIHAALLALPPRLGDGALLLLGDSGAGKSSTALALARGGWALAGDDAAVLLDQAQSGAVEAWGFPRSPKVHPFTAKLLPWLQVHVSPEGEQEVPITTTKLADLVAVAPAERRLPILGVAFLEQRATEHRLTALGATETVIKLAAGHLFAPERRLTRAVTRQFSLLARLAGAARWRVALNLGPDLEGLPSWLEKQFETLAR